MKLRMCSINRGGEMKKYITFLLLACVALPVYAQMTSAAVVSTDLRSNDDVYEYCYYSCKVWGYFKYFHSEVAKGPDTVQWDDALLAHLAEITAQGVTTDQYYQSLLAMLDKAGDMAEPGSDPPEIPEDLKPNLDLSWFDDTFITNNSELQARLLEVQEKFRPQDNYYVTRGLAPNFSSDDGYFACAMNPPPLRIRLLGLFRYWNAIQYFFPYKTIMDQHWDATLVEMLPYFITCACLDDYTGAVLRLSRRIDDTHGFVSGPNVGAFLGQYVIPVAVETVDEHSVVYRVLSDDLDIAVGDILLEINGVPIATLKANLRPFTAASNPAAANRILDIDIFRGEQETQPVNELTLKDASGNTYVAFAARDMTLSLYKSKLHQPQYDTWCIMDCGGQSFGYIHMGLLQSAEIGQMFTDLWDTNGLVFDIRDYPHGTLWYLVNYLFDEDVFIAKFTKPSVTYPGTITWKNETLHVNNTSMGVYNKKLAVIFNEETLSQAEYTSMGLERHPHAVKIGSQTSGADGNVTKIYFPGRLTMMFTGLGVFYPDGTETQRIGIVPDIEVRPTIESIRESRDEPLETALAFLASRVNIDYFLAEQSGNQADISWQAWSEGNLQGWNLYRVDGKWQNPMIAPIPVKLNDDVIPAQGTASEPNVYNYVDPLQGNPMYFYMLEALYTDSDSECWKTILLRD